MRLPHVVRKCSGGEARSGEVQHQRVGLSAGGDSRLWDFARTDGDLLPVVACRTNTDSDAPGTQRDTADRPGADDGLAAWRSAGTGDVRICRGPQGETFRAHGE